jgi:hypothetical protein
MSASVELVCVDPKRAHDIWPHISHLIRRAVTRTNLSHSADIEYDVLHGGGLVWLAWDGRTIKAAATTTLIETDADKVCVVTACAGEGMPVWLPLLGEIEAYAKAEDCACVRIYGRKGWARVLKNYHIAHIILERAL